MITVAINRFDGPLDLLLALVRRNQCPLDDLPIAEITRQKLAPLFGHKTKRSLMELLYFLAGWHL